MEDQISAREAEKEAQNKPVLIAEEIERRERREGLQMSRTKIIRDLETTNNERYRQLLERALKHIDVELEKLEEQ